MTAGLRSKEVTANRNGLVGTAFVHTVIGDRSRVAYSEICADDEATTIGVRQRAVVCFAGRGVTVERLLSDNGSAYRTHARRESHTAVAIIHSDPDPRQTGRSSASTAPCPTAGPTHACTNQ
ncbi:transposase family protein [Rhodococcus triatomae]|nr:transposase family protein [Rhodococcus triatomae]QNG23342.1 transposase family protein [Rhodococcus triatomae]